jgi:hypothetical protein
VTTTQRIQDTGIQDTQRWANFRLSILRYQRRPYDCIG